MSRVKTAFTLFFSLYIFNVTAKEVTIKGTFKNAGKASYIYLTKALGSEYYKFDSVKNNQGEFKFKYKDELPRGLYGIGVDETQFIILILGKESPTINADLKDLPASVIINDSKENEVY